MRKCSRIETLEHNEVTVANSKQGQNENENIGRGCGHWDGGCGARGFGHWGGRYGSGEGVWRWGFSIRRQRFLQFGRVPFPFFLHVFFQFSALFQLFEFFRQHEFLPLRLFEEERLLSLLHRRHLRLLQRLQLRLHFFFWREKKTSSF